MDGLSYVYQNIEQFLIILARVSCFVVITPVFGRKGVPNATKIGLSVALSYLVFLSTDIRTDVTSLNTLSYVLVIFRESLIGFAVGFVSVIFFSLFYTAGQMADVQVGFQLGGMYDQQMQIRVPIIGNLIYVMGFLVFINLNGIEKLISLIVGTYRDIPAVSGTVGFPLNLAILNGFYSAFLFAVKLVMPVVIIMLVVQFLLGIVVKFMPQMNVFIIGIPIKIVLGLMVFFVILRPIYGLITDIFEEMFEISRLVSLAF